LRTNSAVLHLNLAVCRDLSGDVAGAESAFREAVRLASDPAAGWDDPASGRAEAWLKFAIFLDRRNRPDEVIAVYRDGTTHVPESAALWRTLGDALNARLRFDEADAALARARALEKR
jgi:tetratricopeptide (TPR) repeat protein